MVSNVKQQLIITKNELSDLMAMLYAVSLNEKSIPLFSTLGIPHNDETIKKKSLNMHFAKTLDTHLDSLFIKNADTEYTRLYNESLSRTKKRLLSMLTDAAYNGISKKIPFEKILDQFSREFDTITRGLPLMAQTVNTQTMNNKAFDVLVKYGAKEFEIIANEDACEICVDNAGTYTAQEIERLGLFPPFHPNCKCSLAPCTGKENPTETVEQEINQKLYDNFSWYRIHADYITDISDSKNAEWERILKMISDTYNRQKSRYEKIAAETNIPPQLIAAMHYRESAEDFFNETFGVYLHNGQPLGKITTIVPKGKDFKKGQFDVAAADALKGEYNSQTGRFYMETRASQLEIDIDTEDIVSLVAFAVFYNGTGNSQTQGKTSYGYNGTNLITSGHYTSDGVYDPNAIDANIGIYRILKRLME